MFAKLKALLRKAAARTRDALRATIGDMLAALPNECRHHFKAASYASD